MLGLILGYRGRVTTDQLGQFYEVAKHILEGLAETGNQPKLSVDLFAITHLLLVKKLLSTIFGSLAEMGNQQELIVDLFANTHLLCVGMNSLATPIMMGSATNQTAKKSMNGT